MDMKEVALPLQNSTFDFISIDQETSEHGTRIGVRIEDFDEDSDDFNDLLSELRTVLRVTLGRHAFWRLQIVDVNFCTRNAASYFYEALAWYFGHCDRHVHHLEVSGCTVPVDMILHQFLVRFPVLKSLSLGGSIDHHLIEQLLHQHWSTLLAINLMIEGGAATLPPLVKALVDKSACPPNLVLIDIKREATIRLYSMRDEAFYRQLREQKQDSPYAMARVNVHSDWVVLTGQDRFIDGYGFGDLIGELHRYDLEGDGIFRFGMW